MAKKKRTGRKGGGSSMLNPPEREQYQLGSVAGKLAKGLTLSGKALFKKVTAALPKKESDKVIKETEKKLKREVALPPELREDRFIAGVDDPGGYSATSQRDLYIRELEDDLIHPREFEDIAYGPEQISIEELHKVRDEDNALEFLGELQSLLADFKDQGIKVSIIATGRPHWKQKIIVQPHGTSFGNQRVSNENAVETSEHVRTPHVNLFENQRNIYGHAIGNVANQFREPHRNSF